ncbi:MAG: alanine racemase [Clostridiales bacterium]|nr:alanine racemase [Clostridiales bacterium]
MERTYVKIDLDAIRHNVASARKKTGKKVIAIIKADAYGHGAKEVARALDDLVWGFGIAVVDEGIQLRRAGVTKPILVLGNVLPDRLWDVIKYELLPSVSNLETAAALSSLAVERGKTVDIHIGVDTGMGRIGFLPNEMQKIALISRLPNIRITGLCTHYARADETDKTAAKRQREVFEEFDEFLKSIGIYAEKHISNSAGIIEFSDGHYDFVRAGIMTYGLYPSKEVDQNFGLRPALSWYATVSHIKTLPQGVGVSYGHTFVTERETRIATVPIGYADGYPRALSNKGRVLVGGAFAPIVGRVCMDQFMIDVTDIPSADVGSEVVLVGTQGGKTLTVEELADAAHSFNYEFVCGVGLRVPKLYYKGDKYVGRADYLEKI